MKIFDLHADIGYDILEKKKAGIADAFSQHHLPKLQRGGIQYVGVACYFDGKESWLDMQEMVLYANETVLNSEACLVQTAADYSDGDVLHALITVEGMCGITEDVTDKIAWLAAHNVKIASLTWNEENALATGVKGSAVRGVTALGKEALRALHANGLVLDVSHLNEKSFYDVISQFEGKLLATHSNVRNLCAHERNLTNQQIHAIASRGGIIGMNAAKFFISTEKERQNAYQLAQHARYIKELVGVEHIAIGFDFMDFLSDYDNAMARDLSDASKAQNFLDGLKSVGFTKQEQEQVAWRNAVNFLTK